MNSGRLLLLSILLLAIQIQGSAFLPLDTIKVSLKAIPGLQYDLVRFKVKPGSTVKVILKNTDDMSHNLVITKPGARELVLRAATKLEENGPAMDYIPVTADVLWAIPVLSPGKEKSVVFTAPKSEGAYPYVCTFPGHGYVMYGVMYVTTNEHLPEIENDLNVPPSRREIDSVMAVDNKGHAHHDANAKSPHPYEPKAPYLYRIYMEDASPAAIAVNLPHEVSYCWDAGTCQLRYAWQGGFVDNSAVWKGHHNNEVAKIMGTIFFRPTTTHPLRIGQAEGIPVAAYKGYQLINRFPEFHYTLDGIDVYELIQSKADGTGLIRTFRIPGSSKNVSLYLDRENGVEYETRAGKLDNNRLFLTSGQAREFSIVITKRTK